MRVPVFAMDSRRSDFLIRYISSELFSPIPWGRHLKSRNSRKAEQMPRGGPRQPPLDSQLDCSGPRSTGSRRVAVPAMFLSGLPIPARLGWLPIGLRAADAKGDVTATSLRQDVNARGSGSPTRVPSARLIFSKWQKTPDRRRAEPLRWARGPKPMLLAKRPW